MSFRVIEMYIQLTTNPGLKIVSASTKTVESSAHIFPNNGKNLNLFYTSEAGRFKFGSV